MIVPSMNFPGRIVARTIFMHATLSSHKVGRWWNQTKLDRISVTRPRSHAWTNCDALSESEELFSYANIVLYHNSTTIAPVMRLIIIHRYHSLLRLRLPECVTGQMIAGPQLGRGLERRWSADFTKSHQYQ
jgi:hypothetical protein